MAQPSLGGTSTCSGQPPSRTPPLSLLLLLHRPPSFSRALVTDPGRLPPSQVAQLSLSPSPPSPKKTQQAKTFWLVPQKKNRKKKTNRVTWAPSTQPSTPEPLDLAIASKLLQPWADPLPFSFSFSFIGSCRVPTRARDASHRIAAHRLPEACAVAAQTRQQYSVLYSNKALLRKTASKASRLGPQQNRLQSYCDCDSAPYEYTPRCTRGTAASARYFDHPRATATSQRQLPPRVLELRTRSARLRPSPQKTLSP
ncbi:hypothetical protein CCMA1212_001351 [Trichoderma ghanense]|uniref:Uncharacterized protein n=1 Tax=Trichoderma ghanense TaxID=65468 RepID=A0ABY2HDL5_9HYPO